MPFLAPVPNRDAVADALAQQQGPRFQQVPGSLLDTHNDTYLPSGWLGKGIGAVKRGVEKVTEALTAPGTDALMGGPWGAGALGATLYHGSPHKFDAFNLGKVGTGEGMQAYGHGLYFAESPDVAKAYLKPGNHNYTTPTNIDGMPAKEWLDSKAAGDAEKMAAGAIARNPNIPEALSYLEQDAPWNSTAAQAMQWIKQNESRFNDKSGHLYQVDVPDQAIGNTLDWDKPLSQQSESVKKSLSGLPEITALIQQRSRLINNYDPSGQDIYSALSGWKRGADLSPPAEAASQVSQRLNSMGIPGIKYLDQMSRGKGGTSNYVLFDDQLPKIVNRQ